MSIIDGHAHIEPELSVAGLVAAMDDAGIDRAALIAAAQTPIPPINPAGPAFFRACIRVPPLRMPLYKIARERMHQLPRPDNPAVFEAARAHPGRFLPYAFVNARLGAEAHDELDRWIAEGAAGVKLHLWFHRYRLPEALPLLDRCARAGLPVLAHLGFGPAEDVAVVLEKVPSLKLILAHAGLPHFEKLWRLPRVKFDVAAPQFVSRGTIKRLLAAVGPDRVVFGSDAPVGIRTRGGVHRYEPPALPSKCYGDTLSAFL
jgi:hypothetical protein